MSNTENLGLKIPTLAEKNIHTTYVDNNDIIDEAYGQYLEDKETAQENIAMIESSTAQSNHTAGSYFMLDNVLHKATINIASGDTIVSGSNATPITIEQALSALNSSVQALQNSVSMHVETKTLTVNDFGNVRLGFDNNTIVLSVTPATDNTYTCIPFIHANGSWFSYIVKNVSGTYPTYVNANTSVTLRIIYMNAII